MAILAGIMPGAATLAARAASGAGAGYVKLLTHDSSLSLPPDIVCDSNPLSLSLSDKRINAVLAGPGLGRGNEARDLLAAALESGLPAVLDADALMLLDPDMLEGKDTSKLLVTPHAGELAALCVAFAIKGENKRERAARLADSTGLTVLAKGPDTILASAGRIDYFPSGPSWLSVAGSGDVLAGIIVSRLASRGTSPHAAASQAVWLHHQAARQAGTAFSADDLARCVPSAYAALL